MAGDRATSARFMGGGCRGVCVFMLCVCEGCCDGCGVEVWHWMFLLFLVVVAISRSICHPTVHTPNMNIGNRVPNLNRKIKTIGILRLVNITTTRWVNRRVEWNRINLICNVMGARSEVGNQIKCAVEQQKARENAQTELFFFLINIYIYMGQDTRRRRVCAPRVYQHSDL